MSSKARQLARLGEITEVIWETASQKLREKAQAERAIAERIAALGRKQRACSDELSQPDIPASDMMSAVRWMKWSEMERRRINIQLARARAELARERAQAKRAFGKKAAVEALQKAVSDPRPGLSRFGRSGG